MERVAGLQEGERVTFITCPEAASTLRKQGFLTSRPPGTKPGEPLVAVNHALGTRTQLLRPPSKAASALPQWLPVVLGSFVATELGSGFFDPNLPALIAGGLAVAGTSYVSGSQLLIPRLKQLPESSVRISAIYLPAHCIPLLLYLGSTAAFRLLDTFSRRNDGKNSGSDSLCAFLRSCCANAWTHSLVKNVFEVLAAGGHRGSAAGPAGEAHGAGGSIEGVERKHQGGCAITRSFMAASGAGPFTIPASVHESSL